MKTNNVDFGKSFKFKRKNADKDNDAIYTYTLLEDCYSALVTWPKTRDFSAGSCKYLFDEARDMVEDGLWIVLPTDMKEIVGDIGPELSFQTNARITDTLLNEIKSFTATSKHSVNIYSGAYEVFRSGEDMAYQCKDDTSLRSVMQALKVLDGVSLNEASND